jgi:hypothetical protein
MNWEQAGAIAKWEAGDRTRSARMTLSQSETMQDSGTVRHWAEH